MSYYSDHIYHNWIYIVLFMLHWGLARISRRSSSRICVTNFHHVSILHGAWHGVTWEELISVLALFRQLENRMRDWFVRFEISKFKWHVKCHIASVLLVCTKVLLLPKSALEGTASALNRRKFLMFQYFDLDIVELNSWFRNGINQNVKHVVCFIFL